MNPPRNYWMIVTSPNNFRATVERGFTIQGVKSTQRKKAQRFEPGDRLLYYLTGAQSFAATATVTSNSFEDATPIWHSDKPEETYPYRVNIRPEAVLEEGEWIDARQIAPRMEYVKKWPPEHWPLAFQGNLHLIPRSDFTLIEEEMRKVKAERRAMAET